MSTVRQNPDVPIFHQKIFETPNADLPIEDRTLMSIRTQRAQRLTNDKVENLVSPGSFNLTPDDKRVSGSNTRALFKNLYGETPLTFAFFSNKNIQNIQDLIKFVVHRETGYVIDNQSVNELMIIMRSIFLEYSLHPKLIDEKMTSQEKSELIIKYKNEVSRLNQIVINAIVPKIISQIQQYLDYLRDASEQPYQMDKPKNESITGQKEYRSTTQVLFGGDF
jgi:hypothetical protein